MPILAFLVDIDDYYALARIFVYSLNYIFKQNMV